MKTINGNNKLERQINKALKYSGVTLELSSNKYLRIADFDKENTYIYFLTKDETGHKNYNLAKDFTLWVLKPLNWKNEKPFFINRYQTIEIIDNWFLEQDAIIFRTENQELKEIATGCDDVMPLQEFINQRKQQNENFNIFIERN